MADTPDTAPTDADEKQDVIADAPAEEEEELDDGQPSTHFNFRHKVFAVESSYFSLSADKKVAVLNIPLGTAFGSVPVPTLRATFGIKDGSRDDKLLKIVESGLRFCKEIRPGESIPRELLDGSASWSVSDEHRTLAKNRMSIQLASWVSGNEVVISDPGQIEQIFGDPTTQHKLNQAYDSLTEKLGLTPDKRSLVEERVASFAHELAYIEALRDQFGKVRLIGENLEKLRVVYRADRTFVNDVLQVQRLFRRPLTEFQTIFDQVDAQTGEVLALLKGLKARIDFTRKMRDELHCRFLDWEDILKPWLDMIPERSTYNENQVKAAYRFLAQRYLQTTVWKRE